METLNTKALSVNDGQLGNDRDQDISQFFIIIDQKLHVLEELVDTFINTLLTLVSIFGAVAKRELLVEDLLRLRSFLHFQNDF